MPIVEYSDIYICNIVEFMLDICGVCIECTSASCVLPGSIIFCPKVVLGCQCIDSEITCFRITWSSEFTCIAEECLEYFVLRGYVNCCLKYLYTVCSALCEACDGGSDR